MHFSLELSAKCPLRSNIALRFRWRQITWNMYSFYYFLWKPYDTLFKYQIHGLIVTSFRSTLQSTSGHPWPSTKFRSWYWNFYFFCHKHFHIYSVLLRNMRLSNFTFLSVLSFADKPKLAYLTRPTKKGKNAQIVCKNQHRFKYDIWKQNKP